MGAFTNSFTRGLVQVGSLLNQIPLKSDALFWLDGIIIDVEGTKYFKDKTANARNFLITDYDFDSTWVAGMPYKSAATISAPAADATLIAADINNYLYDSGGTPNQIPVVSLFQDIDYEHKLFCRHFAQVVDANGVETNEPRVLDIVLYNTVKEAGELTLCQNYYSVPTEDLTAVWLAVDGNDSTGDGSKANPYLTINKIKSTTATTVYLRSGDYVISRATIFTGNALNLFGTGLSKVSNNTSSYSIFNRDIYYKHIDYTANNYANPIITTAKLEFEKSKLTKTDGAQFIASNAGATTIGFYKCVVNSKFYNGLISTQSGAFTKLVLDTCFGNICASLYSPNYIEEVDIKNNVFNTGTLNLTATTKARIIGNSITAPDSNHTFKLIGANDQNNSDTQIKFNKFYANNSEGYLVYVGALYESGYNAFNGIEFIGNYIYNDYLGTISNTSHDLFIGGGIDNKVKYNRIESGNGYNIVIKAGGYTYTTTDAHISYNVLITRSGGALRHSISNRGTDGLIIGNNTIIGFTGTSIFKTDADISGTLDNSSLLLNNLISLSGNTTYAQGANTTSRNNSVNKGGNTCVLGANDFESSVVIDVNGVPASKIENAEVITDDALTNNVGLASNYVIPTAITYQNQDSVTWQNGAVILP